MKINENDIVFLRSELNKFISGKRLTHSLAVEEEAAHLGKLFKLSESTVNKLRVCAILHDITKEKSTEEQIALCEGFGHKVSAEDVNSPKVFHSVTGAYLAKKLYGNYVCRTVFNGIKYHTTGRENMTLFEKLVYLADYIEPTRTFDDCVKLREYFYSAKEFTIEHLNATLLLSYDMTIKNLLDENKCVHSATIKARNYLIFERNNI